MKKITGMSAEIIKIILKLIFLVVFIINFFTLIERSYDYNYYISISAMSIVVLLWTLLAIHDKLVEINKNLKRLNEFNEQQDRNKG